MSYAEWVFIERVGDLYLGAALDEDGRKLLEITEPVTDIEIHAKMREVSDESCYDIDIALYEADKRPNDGRTPERKFFHLLRARAKAGLASQSDGAWVVNQLRDPNSIHRTIFLLWTLGYMGPQYEHAVTPFLDDGNTDEEVWYAKDALIRMGLIDKYADLFRARTGKRSGR